VCLLLLCTVLPLCGCGPKVPQPSVQPDSPTAEISPVPEKSILDTRQAMDESGVLWKLPVDAMNGGVSQSLFLFGEDLLLYGPVEKEPGVYITRAAVISTKTGEVLAERDCSEYSSFSFQVCGECLLLSDGSAGKVLYLDRTLSVVDEYRFSLGGGAIYGDKTGNRLYFLAPENGIHTVDRSTGETSVLLQGEAVRLYPSVHRDNFVSFGYVDPATQLSVTAVLNLGTGQVEALPFEGSFYAVQRSADLWMAKNHESDDVFYYGRQGYIRTFTVEESYANVSLLPDAAGIVISSYGREGISAVSLYGADGSFISRCDLNGLGLASVGMPLWVEEKGGCYLSAMTGEGRDILLFWDVSTPMSGDSLQFEPLRQEKPGGVVATALYDRAAAMSEAYGVQIHIAEQGKLDDEAWKAERVYDEALIGSALTQLEAVLSVYPDGFLSQLRYGSQQAVHVFLVGYVSDGSIPENSSGFTSYTGFALQRTAGNIIAIDITQPGQLEKTIHHELAHLIDYRLAFDANLRPEALFSEETWSLYNPEDFAYPNRRYDLPASMYRQDYDLYFVDFYSRTNAFEDRARILEYALVGSDWIFSSAPVRLQKLQYLADCIRDAFDTAGWPEETVWEQTARRCAK